MGKLHLHRAGVKKRANKDLSRSGPCRIRAHTQPAFCRLAKMSWGAAPTIPLHREKRYYKITRLHEKVKGLKSNRMKMFMDAAGWDCLRGLPPAAAITWGPVWRMGARTGSLPHTPPRFGLASYFYCGRAALGMGSSGRRRPH